MNMSLVLREENIGVYNAEQGTELHMIQLQFCILIICLVEKKSLFLHTPLSYQLAYSNLPNTSQIHNVI